MSSDRTLKSFLPITNQHHSSSWAHFRPGFQKGFMISCCCSLNLQNEAQVCKEEPEAFNLQLWWNCRDLDWGHWRIPASYMSVFMTVIAVSSCYCHNFVWKKNNIKVKLWPLSTAESKALTTQMYFIWPTMYLIKDLAIVTVLPLVSC